MPTNICFAQGNENSAKADFFLKWLSIISFAFNVVFIGFAWLDEKNRKWPRRTELFVILSVLCLQTAWTMGALTDFKQLTTAGEGDSSEGFGEVGSWQAKMCFSQGVMFQWSAFMMVLTFIWYQLSRYMMLSRGVPSTQVADMEFCVVLVIIIFSTLCTAMPVLLSNIGTHRNLYACW
jgi:hypothetical protein